MVMRAFDRYDLQRRGAEKAACRRADEARLDDGQVGARELAAANSFFSSLGVSRFELQAVGRKRLNSVS